MLGVYALGLNKSAINRDTFGIVNFLHGFQMDHRQQGNLQSLTIWAQVSQKHQYF